MPQFVCPRFFASEHSLDFPLSLLRNGLPHLAETVPDQVDIVQARENSQRKGCAQEERPRTPHPMFRIDLKQHHKQNRRDLSQGVAFAKNAGTKITQACDCIEHSANQQDADVAAEDQDREFPGNEVDHGEHEKDCAQQHLVGNGVQVLAEQGLLMQAARKQAVESVAETGEQGQDECFFVMMFE